MKTYAIIPTQLKSPILYKLVNNLKEDKGVTKIFVIDNTDRGQLLLSDSKIKIIHMPHKSVYEMWNSAWDLCKELAGEDFNIAFLNDDIELRQDSVGLLGYFLRVMGLGIIYPDVNAKGRPIPEALTQTELTDTTGGAGGMTGYCFVVRGEIESRVDENLKLYWGDDDLVKQVLNEGYKVGKLVGLPIEHIGSATINTMNRAERLAIMEQDRAYFNRKYQENRSPVEW